MPHEVTEKLENIALASLHGAQYVYIEEDQKKMRAEVREMLTCVLAALDD